MLSSPHRPIFKEQFHENIQVLRARLSMNARLHIFAYQFVMTISTLSNRLFWLLQDFVSNPLVKTYFQKLDCNSTSIYGREEKGITERAQNALYLEYWWLMTMKTKMNFDSSIVAAAAFSTFPLSSFVSWKKSDLAFGRTPRWTCKPKRPNSISCLVEY